MSTKFHILYEFKSGPWGGGNQFLKALKEQLIHKNQYAEDIEETDIILFNSHHFGNDLSELKSLLEIKKRNPNIRFIHRLDGPISLIRGGSKSIDQLIFEINDFIADGTVYQTDWSKDNSGRIGLRTNHPNTNIINAPDPRFFHPAQEKEIGKKIKIINSSWASNKRKGSDTLLFLDQNLDFSKYELTFVGNTSVKFDNIKVMPPQDSLSLGNILRDHDIFLAPSINDPCSNALCEALHCGLPALVKNSGGHPELLKKGGLTFESEDDLLQRLDELAASYFTFRNMIEMDSIDKITSQYLAFAQTLFENTQNLKMFSVKDIKNRLMIYEFKRKLHDKLKNRLPKIFGE